MRDPFEILGLRRGAAASEIKRAFRKLAMAWHPDRNPTHDAEERFKHIKAAYELLLDPERLAAWDATQAGDGTDADDDHDADDEVAAARTDIHLTLHLTLEEAAHGCVKTIGLASDAPCTACGGAGRTEHTHSVACAECKGVGRIRNGQGTGHCAACGGRGYLRVTPCPVCSGRGWQESLRQLEVRIPPAMIPGERLRLARQHRPRQGGPAGDLFLAIAIRPHPFFRLDGRDLECEVPVGIFALLAGATIEIPTVAGTQLIDVPPFPRHGLDHVLPGLGFPGRHGRAAGALRLRLRPVYPAQCDEAEQKLLARLHKAMLADATDRAPELAEWEAKLRARRA